jgi:hypothetical protein
MFVLSEHARRRCEQRGICKRAIEAAWDWGQMIPQDNGRTAFYLGRRSVNYARRRYGLQLSPYKGTLIVVASDGTLITAIRTSHLRKTPKKGQGKPLALPWLQRQAG